MASTSQDVATIERGAIGLVLMSKRVPFDMDALTPAHFASELHAEAWRVVRAMEADGLAVDTHTFNANRARIGGHVRHAATPMWVADCLHAAPVGALAGQYANLIINAAHFRELESALARSGDIVEGATDAADATEAIRAEFDKITPATVGGSMLDDTLAASIAAFDEPSRAIPTPWRGLNSSLLGWRPGGLYIIGARPGSGKSIAAIQAALYLARSGPVAFNTLEMSTHEVNQRIIAHTASVHLSRLQGTLNGRPNLDANDRALIEDARRYLTGLPLSIRDDRAVTITGIRSHARSLSRRGPLAGIVVDYLQLLRSERGDNRPRHEIVADYSRSLKMMAGEMDCPVIALSQLNRGAAGSAASLANLRESGALEQDADVVILLSQPELRGDDGAMTVDEGHIIMDVAKNRHGPPAYLTLVRDGAHSTIGSRAELEPINTNERANHG